MTERYVQEQRIFPMDKTEFAKRLMNVRDRIDQSFADILENRMRIKEDYVKAWLAFNVPDGELNDEIWKKIVLVESKEYNQITYRVAFREEIEKEENTEKYYKKVENELEKVIDLLEKDYDELRNNMITQIENIKDLITPN